MDSWVIGQSAPHTVCEYLLGQGDINGAPIVCFDYFDTLIVRDIQPEFTKQLAARLLAQLLDNALPPEELYSIRQELEKQLCQENLASGGELEFYLIDFAAAYYQLLQSRNIDSLKSISIEDFTDSILDIETSVELAVQRPCLESIELLKSLKEKKIQTVLISDFYLPGTHLKKLLQHFDLFDLFDHIYISSDHRLAKGSGRLYEKVCEDLSCNPSQLIMIGDNPHADIDMARKLGAQAIQLINPGQRQFYETWDPQILENAEQRNKRFASGVPSQTVFPEMAYTLWLFTKRLFHELIQ